MSITSMSLPIKFESVLNCQYGGVGDGPHGLINGIIIWFFLRKLKILLFGKFTNYFLKI